jgi:hypothetical protein
MSRAATRTRVDGRSKRVKLSAVMAADMVGVVAAAKQTGFPESSIRYWRDLPEFAEFRANTRRELGEDVKLVAFLAWKRVADTMPTMEPRDAIFAAEKATTLLQLLSGEATERTETITDGLDDHEKAALRTAIKNALTETPT